MCSTSFQEKYIREPLDREYPSCPKGTKPYSHILHTSDFDDLHADLLAKWKDRQKWLKDNTKWDKLQAEVRKGQLYRRLQTEKEERMMQDCICKAEKDKCHRQRQIAQEQNFAEAMKELKEGEIRDAAFRKQLHACVPEIRDLEHELRRAYYAKTLHAQRLEREAMELEEKMRQQEMYEMLKEALLKYDEAEAEKERLQLKMKCDYREQLEHQLTDATSKAAKDKEQLDRDKAMVDEILELIKKEEIDDLIEKTNKVKLYRSEIDNFLEARENQRQREKMRQKKEEERDAEYLNTKQEQKAAYDQARAERDKAKAAIIEKAVEQMMQIQFAREELEDLRRELHDEEMEESVRKKEAEELEKKCRTQRELREAELEGKRMRAEKLAADREEDEKFKEQLMLQFAENDRLELLGLSKRRQKEREHRLKVEEMIAERRALRAQEREKELEIRHCAEEEEKRRQDLIDIERRKLLQEHGPKLLGFIPRGTIKSQKELDELGEPFLTYYRTGTAQFREPDPTTVDFEPCEEELFKNMELPKNIKY